MLMNNLKFECEPMRRQVRAVHFVCRLPSCRCLTTNFGPRNWVDRVVNSLFLLRMLKLDVLYIYIYTATGM